MNIARGCFLHNLWLSLQLFIVLTLDVLLRSIVLMVVLLIQYCVRGMHRSLRFKNEYFIDLTISHPNIAWSSDRVFERWPELLLRSAIFVWLTVVVVCALNVGNSIKRTSVQTIRGRLDRVD